MSNTLFAATTLIPEVLEEAHIKTEHALERLSTFRGEINELFSDLEDMRDAHEDLSEVLGLPLSEMKVFIRSTIRLTKELDEYFSTQPSNVVPFDPNLQLSKLYLREVKEILAGLEVEDV